MRSAVALALYALLTVALTWPLAARLHLMQAGDPAFFAWEIGWETHALKTAPATMPHANIFHPLRYTLGLDEPILGTTLLVLPFSLFTDDAVWLANLARLLTFAVSAWTAFLLARELGVGEGAAFVAGAAFAFSMARCDQIGHWSTLGTQWLPLVLLFLVRFSRTARWTDAALAGFFYSLEALACGYHGLIGLAVVPVAALPLLWGRWRAARRLGPAVLAAAPGLLALYAMHRAALAPQQFVRGPEETLYYSASLESFLAAPHWSLLYGELTAPFRSAANELFVGLTPVVPLVCALSALIRQRRAPSREALAMAALALAAVLVALGPEIRVAGQTLGPGPYGWLRDLVPPFRMIRVPSRAGAFLALGVAMLLGKALARWEGRRLVLAIVLTGVAVESVFVARPDLDEPAVVDSRQPAPEVYRWLGEQPGAFAIVELPMGEIGGPLYKPNFHESIYMLRSTVHWKRLVNGYAGTEPRYYVELKQKLKRFPSAESIAALRELGVRYAVLHRGGYGPPKWGRIERDLPAFAGELRPVASFGRDFVYEIVAPPAGEKAVAARR
jgi:hypothetical protein